MTTPAQHSALMAGYRMLDLSDEKGMLCGKIFADMGVEVIKVERPGGDPARTLPPFYQDDPDPEKSLFWFSYNTSKYGITLDLSKPAAQELAKKLVVWADVAVESFTPKAMRNWGIGYEQLRQVNPQLIMLSTCQQGQTGPHALYPGFGQLMASLAGYYHISGWPDRDPAPPYGAYTDFIAPRFAATVLMAALDYRRRAGKGQHIDLAQYEASLHFLAPALLDYQASGRVLGREGNRSFRSAPHGAYRCQGDNRWLALSVSNDGQWQGLLAALDNPSWGTDPRFATQGARLEHSEELDRLVEAWTVTQEAEAAADALQRAGVPAGVVQNCLDLHQDPRLEAWGMFQYLEHKEMGPSPYEGHQFHLSKTPGELRWAAPVMGQHNEYVFKEILGLSDADITRLSEEKVIW